MKLADYQRAVISGSFALSGSLDGEQALGNPERFRLYRHMIRTRLQGMAQIAFKLSFAAAGPQPFTDSFERYLAAQPPRTPLIRDAVANYGAFARGDRQLLSEGPPHLSDMLLFEESKWRLAYQPCVRPRLGQAGVRELDFEGALVLNPVLRLLRLASFVHTLTEGQTPAGGSCELLVYRPAGVDEVRWYVADPLFAEIVRRSASGETLASLVRTVADQQQRALDEALLESLASSLTLALQRGVLVGVR